ncbi:MAG: CHAT domain-containing protein [Clostridiales bacterium]|nr:CHAT domain-containing protein [Clostridiales bacterium]
MRRWLFALVVCFACLLPFTALAQGVNRALLVGCDEFLTQPNTSPSSRNNVRQMAQTLSGGAMNLENLVTRSGGLSGKAALEELIQTAFSQAEEGDVSYFYISTHGVWEDPSDNGAMTLLLSNGEKEEGVTARELREMFDKIPGTKVLMLDACHAGAMIGKGTGGSFENVFEGGDYKVICSSGGAEKSWFWSGEIAGGAITGEGYFSGALVSGLSAQGAYGADANQDGQITLKELKRYLLNHHGASTARVYPEEDDFVVLSYDAESFVRRRSGLPVGRVTYGDDVLLTRQPEISFTFNMMESAQVAYQLVYHRSGVWDFDHSKLIYDDAERFGAFGDARGYLSPGLKERTIALTQAQEDTYGYVLLQLLTMQNGRVHLASSHVLCVPPQSGDPALDMTVSGDFSPGQGQEMTFAVHHAFPCEMTVTVEDESGATVRRLCSRQASRPEQLTPAGSTFCWSGQLSDGTLAPAGTYRIRVKAYVGTEMYEITSEPFRLLETSTP